MQPTEEQLNIALQALSAISCTSHDPDTRVQATRTLDVIDGMRGGEGYWNDHWYLSPDDPMRDHECRRVATFIRGRGRDIWLGELEEPIEGSRKDGHVHWKERYCLHIRTPFKQFVMGLDGIGDGACMGLICALMQDGVTLNQTYVDRKLDDLDPHRPMFD